MLSFEVGARLFFPREASALFSDRDLRTGRDFIVEHPVRGFALKPGFRDQTYRVNDAGFRGAELPEALEGYRLILALGESTTWGWGVFEGGDYPSFLQKELAPVTGGRPVLVVNAGVPSYSSSQVRLYLDELLDQMQPELVLISVLWNDLWYSTIENWYPEILVTQRPPAWRRFLLRYSGLYRAISLPASTAGPLENVFNNEALAHYGHNIEEMIERCRAHEVKLAFVSAPINEGAVKSRGFNPYDQMRLTKPFFLSAAHRYAQTLRELASQHGIPVIEHRLGLGQPKPESLFRDELHPTARGNALMARDVARSILDRGLLAGP